MQTSAAAISRVKLAELSSAVGAGVLGIGIGALLSPSLIEIEVLVLLVGFLMHSWGMIDRRRLGEAVDTERPAWSTALYALCWTNVTVMALTVAARALR
jgi:hypothetical protein